MNLPIIAYGDPVLRKRAKDIEPGSIDVKKLSDDMFETMYAASGIGLAAPQIGQSIRMFVVDGDPLNEGEAEDDIDQSQVGFNKVFINPEIIEEPYVYIAPQSGISLIISLIGAILYSSLLCTLPSSRLILVGIILWLTERPWRNVSFHCPNLPI